MPEKQNDKNTEAQRCNMRIGVKGKPGFPFLQLFRKLKFLTDQLLLDYLHKLYLLNTSREKINNNISSGKRSGQTTSHRAIRLNIQETNLSKTYVPDFIEAQLGRFLYCK